MTELKDLYLAQCEQWIIGQRSACQYLLGINDIYGWMICAGSKLLPAAGWSYDTRKYEEEPCAEPPDNPIQAMIDACQLYRNGSPSPETVKIYGQAAKDAHLDELRRGEKAYPRPIPLKRSRQWGL